MRDDFDLYEFNNILRERSLSKVIQISDLTIDILKDMFPNITPGMGGLAFPNPNDQYSMVGDVEDLERWVERTTDRYGDVKVSINPAEKSIYKRIEVQDTAFNQAKEDYFKGKSAALQDYISKD